MDKEEVPRKEIEEGNAQKKRDPKEKEKVRPPPMEDLSFVQNPLQKEKVKACQKDHRLMLPLAQRRKNKRPMLKVRGKKLSRPLPRCQRRRERRSLRPRLHLETPFGLEMTNHWQCNPPTGLLFSLMDGMKVQQPSVNGDHQNTLPGWYMAVHAHHLSSTLHRAFASTSVELRQCPTFVIMDLGCPRAMGSRSACNRFMKGATSVGLGYELLPERSKFTFDNND